MKKMVTKLTIFALATVPVLVYSQPLKDINDVAKKATNIGDLVIQLTISLAVLWIIVSVVRYFVISATDEEGRKKGKDAIMYGVIGLFVIFSIWGLVSLLTGTFRFSNNQRPSFENLKISNTIK